MMEAKEKKGAVEQSRSMPKLRFPEFKDEWRKQKLESHINLISGFAFKGDNISEDSSGTPLLRGINITEGYIRHSTDIDRYYTKSTENLNKYFLKKDDLVLGMDGSKVGKNVALISRKDEGALLIQRVARLRAKSTTDISYIYLNIFSSRFHRYVDVVNTSSGIPHISAKQIKEFEVGFPSKPEQQKIASFLSAVDQKINQLQRKKELLQAYKKGMMQQLFSQQLRFKPAQSGVEGDENGNDFPDWEEKKLGDVGRIIGGGTPPTTNEDFWNGNIQWFTPTEIKSNYVFKSSRTITALGLKKSSAKILPKGTILLTTRATIGDVAIAEEECTTNQGFQSIAVNKNNNNVFLANWIKMNKHLLIRRANGSTFIEISKSEIQKIKIHLPSKEEQSKIATFLSALDGKIDTVSTAITQTQDFKKGLLQQMFV